MRSITAPVAAFHGLSVCYVRLLVGILLAANLIQARLAAEDESVAKPIARWTFDAKNGKDSSGNKRDLTLHGDPGFVAVPKGGHALDFTAFDNSQYGSLASQLPDFQSDDFTMWVKVRFKKGFDAVGKTNTLLEKFGGSNGPGWSLEVSTNKGTSQPVTTVAFHLVQAKDVTSEDLVASKAILNAPISLDDRYHTFSVRRKGKKLELLLDGKVVHSAVTDQPLPNINQPLLLGKRIGAQNHATVGSIDDAGVSKRCLSDQELAELN